MSRRLGAVACLALISLSPGCGGGGGDDRVSETTVRKCLVKGRIGLRPPQSGDAESTGYAPIFVPDFIAYAPDGTPVAIVVQGSARRAQQTAAHVRSALASLGNPAGGGDRVVSSRNAVAVFKRPPSARLRAEVRSCLAGG